MAARKQKKLEPKIDTQQKDVAEDGDIVRVGKSLWSELQKYHKWVVAFLGFIQPYLLKQFGPWFGSDAEILNKPWAEFYLTVLSQTAPLTISLMIIFVAEVTFWSTIGEQKAGGDSIMGRFVVGALLLFIAAYIGTWFGFRPVPYKEYVPVSEGFSLGSIGMFVNMLVSYFVAYKGVLFFSSVAIAGYGAYAWVTHGRRLMARWSNPNIKAHDKPDA